jgi:hypothetical protein
VAPALPIAAACWRRVLSKGMSSLAWRNVRPS